MASNANTNTSNNATSDPSTTPTALPQPNKPVPQSSHLSLFWKKWSTYFRGGLPISQMDLTGRTIIITGSNIGLGFEATKAFYNMTSGPKTLVLAVRSVEKGEAAKKAIKEDGNTNDVTDIQVWPLDLYSSESVKAFAARANRELERLDIFVENAGVAGGPFELSSDGWEHQLQINVISTFMLAALLMPLLLKTSKLPAPVDGIKLKPHLVILSSGQHAHAHFPQKFHAEILKAFNDKEQYEPVDQYHTTKLLDLLLTRQLAKTLEDEVSSAGSPVVISSVNPGFCQSELMRQVPWFIRQILYTLFAQTTAEGARNIVWASLNNDVPPGAYISDCTVAKIEGYASEPEAFPTQEKLWKELADIIVPIAPETKEFWRM